MKSLVMKSIYAGLGVLGTGKHSVEHLARHLSKQADLSQKEGEKIAHQITVHSEKAISTIQKTINSEVAKVVKVLHEATRPAKKTKVVAKKSKRKAARKVKSAVEAGGAA